MDLLSSRLPVDKNETHSLKNKSIYIYIYSYRYVFKYITQVKS